MSSALSIRAGEFGPPRGPFCKGMNGGGGESGPHYERGWCVMDKDKLIRRITELVNSIDPLNLIFFNHDV